MLHCFRPRRSSQGPQHFAHCAKHGTACGVGVNSPSLVEQLLYDRMAQVLHLHGHI